MKNKTQLFRMCIFILIAILVSYCSKQKSEGRQEGSSVRENRNLSTVSPNAGLRSYYAFSPAQSSAIESLLKNLPRYRIAQASDCSSIFLADIRKQDSTYEPYYKEIDLNIDGIPDFAIALKHDSSFALYWFEGVDTLYSKPELLLSANWFDECGFSNSKQVGFLKFGHFFSEVGAYFYWNPQLKRLDYSNTVKDEGLELDEEDLESN